MGRGMKHRFGTGKSKTLKARKKEIKKAYARRYQMRYGHYPVFWDEPINFH